MLKAELLGIAVAYYRVSSEEQRQGQTIEAQRNHVRNWCRSREIHLSNEYSDDGDNGEGEFNLRSGGKELWRAAQQREFKTVIVFAVDRTGRTLYACSHFFQKLRDLGVRVISATEDFDPDEATGQLLLGLLAGKSQADKTTIRYRTESGKLLWQNTPDSYTGGAIPFGYMVERRGKRKYYVPCHRRIPGADCAPNDVICYIFHRSKDGATCGTIAEELNARSITTCWVPDDARYHIPSPARWTAQRVEKILRNPFYKGLQLIGDPKKRKEVKREEPIYHQVPALVDEVTWEQAQITLKRNREMADRSAQQFYLLRGKILCPCGCHYCGSPTVGAYMPRGRYYRCNSKTSCASKWLDADAIEEQVKADVLWILGHADVFIDEIQQRLGSQAERIDRYLEEARALDRQQEALNHESNQYLRMRAVDLIKDDGKLREMLSEVEAKKELVIKQATELRNQALKVAEADERLRGSKAVLEACHARLSGGFTSDEWRKLVDLLVDRIEVTTIAPLPPAPRRRGQRRRKEAVPDIYYRVDLSQVVDRTTSGWVIDFTLNHQALARLM